GLTHALPVPFVRPSQSGLSYPGGASANPSCQRSYIRLRVSEGHGRRDVGKVCQPLRKVAERSESVGIDFLGEQAEVVAARACPIEDRPRILDLILVRETLREPE